MSRKSKRAMARLVCEQARVVRLISELEQSNKRADSLLAEKNKAELLCTHYGDVIRDLKATVEKQRRPDVIVAKKSNAPGMPRGEMFVVQMTIDARHAQHAFRAYSAETSKRGEWASVQDYADRTAYELYAHLRKGLEQILSDNGCSEVVV